MLIGVRIFDATCYWPGIRDFSISVKSLPKISLRTHSLSKCAINFPCYFRIASRILLTVVSLNKQAYSFQSSTG